MEQLYQAISGEYKWVVAVVLAVIGATKWLIGRQDVQFSRRKDFLQHWTDPEQMNAIAVEVLARQLVGAYLPAEVVRRVCRDPGSEIVRSLGNLADVWPLVEWDGRAGALKWKRVARSALQRRVSLALLWLMYVGFGIVGCSMLLAALAEPISSLSQLSVLLGGAVSVAAAVVSLHKTDTWGAAHRQGDLFLQQINGLGKPAGAPPPGMPDAGQ